MSTNSRMLFRPDLILLLTEVIYYSNLTNAVTTIQPLSLSVLAGDSATFACTTDDMSYLWQWFKVKGKTVQNLALEDKFTLPEYKLVISKGSSRITKLNVSTEDDRSQFYCQYGSVSQMATLSVISSTEIDSMYPQCDVDIASANTEKRVTFTCNMSRWDPQPPLQWYDEDNSVDQETFFCHDNTSYCAKFHYSLSIEDEGKIFVCKTGGMLTQSCSGNLKIPPTVVVSTRSPTFYDGDLLEVVCAAESPWRVIDYQWHISRELSEYILKENGRVMLISNLDKNYAGIDVTCNVTTASGLVGSDVLYITDITEKCDNFMLLISCFSVAVVTAFILGLCLSKAVKSKSKKYSPNTNIEINKDKFKQIDYDSHEYETVLIDEKPATVNENKTTTTTGYAPLKKTSASKYKEINPSPINLEYSEYMSTE